MDGALSVLVIPVVLYLSASYEVSFPSGFTSMSLPALSSSPAQEMPSCSSKSPHEVHLRRAQTHSAKLIWVRQEASEKPIVGAHIRIVGVKC